MKPCLKRDKNTGMEGQWFCWSKNWLGADSINTFKTKHQLQVGLHEMQRSWLPLENIWLWPQLKWASSYSIFISRIGSFRAFQGVRVLASKQSVYCCWQDQISLTNKFLDTKWHYVYIYTHIWPEPQSPYNTLSKSVPKVVLGSHLELIVLILPCY